MLLKENDFTKISIKELGTGPFFGEHIVIKELFKIYTTNFPVVSNFINHFR